ncbi:class I SAM-dependent methyltransferase [Fictibacillus macauensis]|nr:class I SAM-dependent methyltransferase [Fictibacillus macauensis]
MVGAEFNELVAFFDGMARTKWLGAIHDTLKEKTGSWQDQDVLDVGCGTGRLLLRGADEAASLTGLDLSTEMIKASQQNFFYHEYSQKSEFIVGDACQLPFSSQQFDLVVSTCVMFLLPVPQEGIREMLRVTKQGGAIAMLNPSVKMSQQEAFQYCKNHGITGFEQTTMLKWANVSTKRHRYDEEGLRLLLQQEGAQDVEHHSVLEGLAMITYAKKR